nr:glycosyl hydrolase family 28 protein [uncultured Pedobacter sp.]
MRKPVLSLIMVIVCVTGFSCSKKAKSEIAPNNTKDTVVTTPPVTPPTDTDPPVTFSLVPVPKISTKTFLITDYGATTGSLDNKQEILNAINAAYTAGGGTVVVPAGTFTSGPIKLKNNVGLQISSGATLKVIAYSSYPGSGTTAKVASFIDLTGLTNVKVSGAGTIEGQGAAWWDAYKATKATAGIARPAMINFTDANTVEISGITIQNAPNSHLSVSKNNNNVTISGVTINSPPTSPNTDGIDVWCQNVYIAKCNISCGDDNIAMNNNSKNVTITGCTFGAGHGCSIGSYTAGIENITVDSCTFNGTDNGVHIKSSRDRSGTVQHLTFKNLTMKNVSKPINVCEYYPDNTIPSSASGDVAQAITSTTPVWQHMLFQNITATGAATAGLIWAVPEKPLIDLVFDNVKISASKGLIANYIGDASFINGSQITVTSGNAFTSTYKSNITGIDLVTGKTK